MEESALFTINGARFVAVERLHTIPRSLGLTIAANLERFVSKPSMQLAVFDQVVHSDRPAALALGSDGTLIAVYLAGLEHDTIALEGRIVATEAWLTPLRLRDLSELFTDTSIFYEGLLDLSPTSTLAIAERRRTLVITADHSLDRNLLLDAVGSGILEMIELDVFGSDDANAPLVRWHDTTTLEQPPLPPEIPSDIPRVEVRATALIDLDEPETPDLIDVDEPETPDLIDLAALDGHAEPPNISPGQSYRIESLPNLFDPTEQMIESISDEMFAVPGHLVLVDEVSDKRRRVSAFDSSHRYRWDASPEQLGLLRQHLRSRGQATLHLFVESDRQVGVATYVGTLVDLSNDSGRTRGSVWFHIEPPIAPTLFKALRKGRLPQIAAASPDSVGAGP